MSGNNIFRHLEKHGSYNYTNITLHIKEEIEDKLCSNIQRGK